MDNAWDLDRSVAVVTAVGVPVDEALEDIGRNARREVIHLKCDYEEDWLNPLEEGWLIQSMNQWVEWINRPDTEDEVPNIDWLIAIFPGRKKDDGKPDSIIK